MNLEEVLNMLSIKLARIGKNHNAFFRVILIDKQKDTKGRYLENFGTYNPISKETKLNAEQIKDWIRKGAQPTKTLRNLLITHKIIEGKKSRVSSLTKKRKEKLAKETANKA